MLAEIERSGASVQTVMAHSAPAANALYFFSDARLRTIPMPWVFWLQNRRAAESCTLSLASSAPPLYFKYGKGVSIFLFAEHLMETIKTENISHIVTTGFYGPEMDEYLNLHPAFKRIAFLAGPPNRRIGLWSVDRSKLAVMKFSAFVDRKTIEAVSELREKEPRRYEAMIAGIESRPGPEFDRHYFESWFPFGASKTRERSGQ